MRFHPRALDLKWKRGTKRPDKSNAIDMLCSGQVPPKNKVEMEDYNAKFENDQPPDPFTAEEREKWVEQLSEVACSSDAFFPFTDNVYRAARSGVKYIAAPVGSQNDAAVFDAAQHCGITFIEQPVRIFHH
jgi:phosphoribosylaminoimidazolecarboxamide formyltransferase/IMP cyclohydrolase